jgi:DNA-binding response OmpR family regulator
MPKAFSVLLVEDDDPLRVCLTEVLASQGWIVHQAASGGRALELARSVPLDFSILDLHLPGMSGLDLLRIISSEIGPLPSIMMSGRASREEAAAALGSGAFSFLRKPLELNGFRASLRQLIQHHFGTTGTGGPRLPFGPGR